MAIEGGLRGNLAAGTRLVAASNEQSPEREET